MRRIIAEKTYSGEKTTIFVTRDFSVFPLPRVVRLELSSRCNLRCIHCPTGIKKGSPRGDMSFEIFNRIIDELKKYSGVDVAVPYHGGEPFLNKNIFEMIRTLKSIGIHFIKIDTNGMLISDKVISEIIESGIDLIYFSLDGRSPAENNRIRRGSDYYKVIFIVKKLLVQKMKLGSKNPRVAIVNSQIPTEAQIKHNAQASIPKFILDDFRDFSGQIEFQSTHSYQWPGFEQFNQFKLAENPAKVGLLSNYCDQIMQTITFRWNGDVVPCCNDILSKCVMGNIKNKSLDDIWNNAKYREMRQKISLRQYPSLCSQCSTINPNRFFLVRKV